MANSEQSEIESFGYYRLNQVLSVIPIGKSTWWKWVAEGKAPKPVKLGPRTTAWKSNEISKLMAQLEEQGRVP